MGRPATSERTMTPAMASKRPLRFSGESRPIQCRAGNRMRQPRSPVSTTPTSSDGASATALLGVVLRVLDTNSQLKGRLTLSAAVDEVEYQSVLHGDDRVQSYACYCGNHQHSRRWPLRHRSSCQRLWGMRLVAGQAGTTPRATSDALPSVREGDRCSLTSRVLSIALSLFRTSAAQRSIEVSTGAGPTFIRMLSCANSVREVAFE
jgi:hypothetical protein